MTQIREHNSNHNGDEQFPQTRYILMLVERLLTYLCFLYYELLISPFSCLIFSLRSRHNWSSQFLWLHNDYHFVHLFCFVLFFVLFCFSFTFSFIWDIRDRGPSIPYTMNGDMQVTMVLCFMAPAWPFNWQQSAVDIARSLLDLKWQRPAGDTRRWWIHDRWIHHSSRGSWTSGRLSLPCNLVGKLSTASAGHITDDYIGSPC